MIICKLQGGLGNQMFQYSFAKWFSLYTNRKLILDLSRLNDHREVEGHTIRDLDLSVFDIELNTIDNIPGWEKTEDFHFIVEPRYNEIIHHRNFFQFLENNYESIRYIAPEETIYIDGHFQKFRWSFPGFFEFKDKSKSPLHKEIIESKNPTVCINIRRGDYLTNYKDFFYHLTLENYFHPAIEYMESELEDAHYYIFSDDIEWCKENIKILRDGHPKFTIVEHTEKGHKFSKYLEMMSKCDHFIIPNSSFAYWAAVIGQKSYSIVISPRNWFKDSKVNDYGLQPENWIRL